MQQPKPGQIQCLDDYWYDSFRDPFFLTVRTCLKEFTIAITTSHFMKKWS